MTPIRVLIVDDHPVLRTGIRTFLQSNNRIEIVDEATTGEEALERLKALQPDILLLDINLPDCNGIEVVEAVHTSELMTQIIVLSAYDDLEYVRRFVAAGVAGYVLKDEAAGLLVQAVEGVARGETGWFSHRIKMQMSQMAPLDEVKGRLTIREIDVLRHLADGKTNYAIAQALNISEKTVEKHLDAIYRKLNVRSRTEAAVAAVRENLL
jgi:two-component system, NarL family, response regulator DegU